MPAGEFGELVLTNLGRRRQPADPLPHRRPGPRGRPTATRPGGPWRRLDGGILGRADDMIHVRGNNLYPAAIEAIVRRFPRSRSTGSSSITPARSPTCGSRSSRVAGDGRDLAEAVRRAVRDELLFRVEVVAVPPGTLPRFEMKARLSRARFRRPSWTEVARLGRAWRLHRRNDRRAATHCNRRRS